MQTSLSPDNTSRGAWVHRSKRIPDVLIDASIRGAYLHHAPYPVHEIVQEFKQRKFISRSMNVITMGSCFAQELATWLDQNKYNRLQHLWGVIYNPASMRQIVQYSENPDSWTPMELTWTDGEKHFDPYRKSDDHTGAYYLGRSITEAHDSLKTHYNESRAMIKSADLAVLTLGLTEHWRSRYDKKVFFTVPYKPFYSVAKHEFSSLSFSEVSEHIRYTISGLRALNPDIKIIFSVSPIPLAISFRLNLGPYVATQFSKSVLHAAVLEHVQTSEGTHYMPSYEIATSDRSRYFKEDGRHVNKECVDTIMNAFEELYVL